MMKKIFLLSILCLTTFSAQAQNIQVSIENGKIKASSSSDVNLYNFSPNLLLAAETCNAYEENFIDNNPELAKIGAFLGNADFSIIVKIKGKNADDKCAFSIQQKVKGMSNVIHECAVDDQTRQELVSAMKDRSTTPVTETYTTYSTMTQPDGTATQIPTQTTQTGSKFSITLAKVIASSCNTQEQEPTEEEKQDLADNILSFSPEFIANLKNCTPAEEKKSMMFFSETYKVLGQEGDVCHLQSNDFDYYVPQDKLAALNKITDFQELSQNKDIAYYRPTYKIQGLVENLKNCSALQDNSTNNATETSSVNNIEITRSQSAQKTSNGCRITLTNIVKIEGETQEFVQECDVPESAINYIKEQTKSYQNIPLSVDEELYQSILGLNVCQEKNN